MKIGSYSRYVMIEQSVQAQVRALQADPETRRQRWGAVEYVKDCLGRRVDAALDECGITPELRARLDDGDETAVCQLLEAAQQDLKLPDVRVRQLRNMAQLMPEGMVTVLRDYLLDKSMTAFGESLGVSTATWRRFANCSGYTSAGTAARIADALELSASERQAFLKLVVRDQFEVVEAFKKKLRSYIKARGMKLSAFCNQAQIGKKAWEPFQKNSQNAVTSQDTLLKLAIGLALPEEKAKDFLALVNSRFVMLRDLVVLACIRCNIYEIGQLRDILDRYANEDSPEPRFRNLY